LVEPRKNYESLHLNETQENLEEQSSDSGNSEGTISEDESEGLSEEKL